ncbi:low affinity Fe/Cu permease [Kaistia defluvii]|uniref:Low affinity Fe/Cu permease n=1 Tax=Kaistia defluvii TaxID=410841 RepID=A0ABV2R281_9HYPH
MTFLMVFLIQNTQNRDSEALQTKLDELIRSSAAKDEFMGIEKLTDKELDALQEKCQASAAKVQESLTTIEKLRQSRAFT